MTGTPARSRSEIVSAALQRDTIPRIATRVGRRLSMRRPESHMRGGSHRRRTARAARKAQSALCIVAIRCRACSCSKLRSVAAASTLAAAAEKHEVPNKEAQEEEEKKRVRSPRTAEARDPAGQHPNTGGPGVKARARRLLRSRPSAVRLGGQVSRGLATSLTRRQSR